MHYPSHFVNCVTLKPHQIFIDSQNHFVGLVNNAFSTNSSKAITKNYTLPYTPATKTKPAQQALVVRSSCVRLSSFLV